MKYFVYINLILSYGFAWVAAYRLWTFRFPSMRGIMWHYFVMAIIAILMSTWALCELKP